MTKLRAFSIHLAASATIVSAFLALMFFVWYPAPYFEVNSGSTVVQILAGVDVVLGPLLALIVFKPGKPSLKFDMGCIIAFQFSALIYGGNIIYQERPAFAVFAVDRFTVVVAGETDFSLLKYPELQRLMGVGPLLAEAKQPEDKKAQQDLMFAILEGREKDLEYHPELYHPYRPDMAHLKAKSIDLQKRAAIDADVKRAVDAFTARTGQPLESFLYFPLRGKHKDIILVLSAKDGMPVDSISINPWVKEVPKKT